MLIRALDRREISRLWSIDRSEIIDHVYRITSDRLALIPEHHDMNGWPPGEREHYQPILQDCFDHDGIFVGAFADETLVGAMALESRFIGRANDQLQLKFLHVGRRHRGAGLGRKLFDLAARRAGELGARRLYISSTSSQNTVDFYLRRGCTPTTERDPALFELEPEDIHLDFEIPT